MSASQAYVNDMVMIRGHLPAMMAFLIIKSKHRRIGRSINAMVVVGMPLQWPATSC